MTVVRRVFIGTGTAQCYYTGAPGDSHLKDTWLSCNTSEVADLKSRLAAQELEIQKANSKFEFSVSKQDKLKKNFEVEKKIWADEKASLVTRAETAEASLTEATTELSDLKRQISQMVSAIFGKLLFITPNIAILPLIISVIVISGSLLCL